MALQTRLTQGWRSRLRRSGIDVASNRIEPRCVCRTPNYRSSQNFL